MGIVRYLKEARSLLTRADVIKTSDLIKSLEEAIEHSQDNLSNLEKIESLDLKNISKVRKDNVVNYFNLSGIKSKDLKDALRKGREVNQAIIEGCKEIIDIIVSDGSKYYMLETLTPRESAILIFGQRLVNASRLVTQLILLSVYELQQDEFIYSKKKDDLVKALQSNSIVISSLRRDVVKKQMKKIKNLSDEPIRDESELTIKDKTFNIYGKSEFTGNPIYHMRRWWADREYEDYERNKYEKKLMQLKLAELQMVAQGENPPINIQEQIEYYEEQVNKYERKIEAYRRG